MLQLVIADVAAGGFLLIGGLFALVAFLALVTLEALVLLAFKWSMKDAFIDSLLMNVVSGLVGIFYTALIDEYTLPTLLLAFALTVAIEGGTLRLRRRAPEQVWKAALVINVLSYIPIGFLLLQG